MSEADRLSHCSVYKKCQTIIYMLRSIAYGKEEHIEKWMLSITIKINELRELEEESIT